MTRLPRLLRSALRWLRGQCPRCGPGTGAQTGGSVTVPPPTSDQRKYVSDLIKWRDGSYTPNSVIGGPVAEGGNVSEKLPTAPTFLLHLIGRPMPPDHETWDVMCDEIRERDHALRLKAVRAALEAVADRLRHTKAGPNDIGGQAFDNGVAISAHVVRALDPETIVAELEGPEEPQSIGWCGFEWNVAYREPCACILPKGHAGRHRTGDDLTHEVKP
jgi:hypothetical protein